MGLLQRSAVQQIVYERMCEEFGRPEQENFTQTEHWALQPYSGAPSINILLKEWKCVPAMWIFDPHDHETGVLCTYIQNESELEGMIAQVQARLKRTRRDRPSFTYVHV